MVAEEEANGVEAGFGLANVRYVFGGLVPRLVHHQSALTVLHSTKLDVNKSQIIQRSIRVLTDILLPSVPVKTKRIQLQKTRK